MPLTNSTDPERWKWLAAGDPDAVPKIARSPQNENSPRRLLFETGVILLIPLALGALIEITLRN